MARNDNTLTYGVHRRRAAQAGLALLCAAALAACGGGGGGGDDGGGGGGGNTTFTIGGRVDGLTGTGLVLQNNGGNNLSISAAGAFQFTQAVAQGAAYNVTVSTQPAGQACAVANGTGTANAAVTNIVVTCSAPLTLQSSTPAANATGVDRSAALTLGFSAPVDVATVAANVTLSRAGQAVAVTAAGSGSTVTVNPQAPLMPLARYTLAAATGLRGSGGQTLGAAASVSFTTRDGAWQGAQAIEAGAGSADFPNIVVDGAGNAIAVWAQQVGNQGDRSAFATRYAAGVGWGTPVLIESEAGDVVQSTVQITIDGSGNALAVWVQFDGTRNSLWANRYAAGSGWGTASLIETSNAGDVSDPQVAMDANGNAMAVWRQTDGQFESIWANRYTAGTGWGTATLVESNSDGRARAPQVAVYSSGEAMAVWSHFDGARYSAWANRYTAAAGWGTPVLLETNNAGDADAPRVAYDGDGNAMALWWQSDGTRNNLWSNRYRAGAGWGTATLVESDAGNVVSPALAFDRAANAMVAVWSQENGTRYSIRTNRYTADTGWGTAAAIEAGSGNAFVPRIAFDSSGNALAVWRQSDATRENIWANRYAAGTGWGTPGLIESDNAGSADAPRIVIDNRGNALAVWHQFDGTRNNIVANRFQ